MLKVRDTVSRSAAERSTGDRRRARGGERGRGARTHASLYTILYRASGSGRLSACIWRKSNKKSQETKKAWGGDPLVLREKRYRSGNTRLESRVGARKSALCATSVACVKRSLLDIITGHSWRGQIERPWFLRGLFWAKLIFPAQHFFRADSSIPVISFVAVFLLAVVVRK